MSAKRQTIQEEEPVGMFMDALNELRASRSGLILDLSDDRFALYPRENCVGFQDANYLYLMPGTAYGAVQDHFRDQGTVFPIGRSQLWKRMADTGLIETFGRDTSRVKYIPGFGSQRLVLVKKAKVDAFTPTGELTPWDDPGVSKSEQEAMKI